MAKTSTLLRVCQRTNLKIPLSQESNSWSRRAFSSSCFCQRSFFPFFRFAEFPVFAGLYSIESIRNNFLPSFVFSLGFKAISCFFSWKGENMQSVSQSRETAKWISMDKKKAEKNFFEPFSVAAMKKKKIDFFPRKTCFEAWRTLPDVFCVLNCARVKLVNQGRVILKDFIFNFLLTYYIALTFKLLKSNVWLSGWGGIDKYFIAFDTRLIRHHVIKRVVIL